MGFDKSKQETGATMSLEMIRNCKKEMWKHGYTEKAYRTFLAEVKAMSTDTTTYVQFPNQDIDKYREKFVKQYESSLGDALMFDELAKVRRQDDKKQWNETGYFCPAYFWNAVRSMTS
jgi:hypothetical protein